MPSGFLKNLDIGLSHSRILIPSITSMPAVTLSITGNEKTFYESTREATRGAYFHFRESPWEVVRNTCLNYHESIKKPLK